MIGEMLSAAAIGIMANGGPCTAARIIAGSACYRRNNRALALSAFTFGAFATDVALVSSLGIFFRALELSSWWYALAAAAALVGFLWTIARPATHRCSQLKSNENVGKEPMLAIPVIAGIGSALLLGACCAPFVIAAAATGVSSANVLAVAVAYAVAHAAVPLLATILSARLWTMDAGPIMGEATIAIQSGMLLGCAIYFGILA